MIFRDWRCGAAFASRCASFVSAGLIACSCVPVVTTRTPRDVVVDRGTRVAEGGSRGVRSIELLRESDGGLDVIVSDGLQCDVFATELVVRRTAVEHRTYELLHVGSYLTAVIAGSLGAIELVGASNVSEPSGPDTTGVTRKDVSFAAGVSFSVVSLGALIYGIATSVAEVDSEEVEELGFRDSHRVRTQSCGTVPVPGAEVIVVGGAALVRSDSRGFAHVDVLGSVSPWILARQSNLVVRSGSAQLQVPAEQYRGRASDIAWTEVSRDSLSDMLRFAETFRGTPHATEAVARALELQVSAAMDATEQALANHEVVAAEEAIATLRGLHTESSIVDGLSARVAVMASDSEGGAFATAAPIEAELGNGESTLPLIESIPTGVQLRDVSAESGWETVARWVVDGRVLYIEIAHDEWDERDDRLRRRVSFRLGDEPRVEVLSFEVLCSDYMVMHAPSASEIVIESVCADEGGEGSGHSTEVFARLLWDESLHSVRLVRSSRLASGRESWVRPHVPVPVLREFEGRALRAADENDHVTASIMSARLDMAGASRAAGRIRDRVALVARRQRAAQEAADRAERQRWYDDFSVAGVRLGSMMSEAQQACVERGGLWAGNTSGTSGSCDHAPQRDPILGINGHFRLGVTSRRARVASVMVLWSPRTTQQLTALADAVVSHLRGRLGDPGNCMGFAGDPAPAACWQISPGRGVVVRTIRMPPNLPVPNPFMLSATFTE